MHIANLRTFIATPERFLGRIRDIIPDPVKDSQGETVYMVDDIINMKVEKKKRFFLVKWTGYDDPSWESEELLRESEDFEVFVDEYLEEIGAGRRVILKMSKGRRMNARAK